ncbi:MAG: hypothetical protein AAF363_05910 [Bacteroidota bacterium]
MLRTAHIALFLFLFFQVKAQSVKSIKDFSIVSANGIEKTIKDFDGFKALVIMVDDQDCAYSEYYIDRFENLKNEFKEEVAFIKVTPSNVNPAGQNVYRDQKGTLLKQLGAKKITEVFLIDLSQGNQIVYSGAFDDNPQISIGVDEHYLKNALNQLISESKIIKPRTRPAGCVIKKI